MVRGNVKLIFDTKNRPELKNAIVDRLVELGFDTKKSYFNRGESSDNVSVGWEDHSIHCGGSPARSSIFSDHELLTLPDLYDANINGKFPKRTHTIVLDDKKIEISEESYKAFKKSLT